MRTRARPGFTLIELAIVIAVIGILAALLVPVIMNQSARAKLAVERESLSELAKSFKRFHSDTGGWPLNDGLWDMRYDITATPFTSSDTALFARPSTLAQCTPSLAGNACWDGPYLGGRNLAEQGFLDQWGRSRLVAMYRPNDGTSGGTSGAPNGMVILYSLGPDGVDGTGCYSGSCTLDPDKLVRGVSSVNGSDDIVVVVSAAR